MKIACIADIHGNALALEAVLKDVEERNIDKICVLGDISYRGPEPQRSLEIIQSLETDVIKGNADEWIVRGIKEGEVGSSVYPIMKEERDWTVSKLSKGDVDYLSNLPTEINDRYHGVHIHAFHAVPGDLFTVIQPDEADNTLVETFIKPNTDIAVYGHIHKPFIRSVNGKCIINTGSVGLPFDGLNQASYAIIEIKESQFDASIIRVKYDVDKVIHQFQVSDYPNKNMMINILRNAKV